MKAIALGLILVTAGTIAAVTVSNVLCGKPALSFPICPSSPISLVIAPQEVNNTMMNTMETTFRSYLLPGDTIMLSSGAGSGVAPPNTTALNSWLARLKPNLPSGINFEARTSGVANVQTIVPGASTGFKAIVYDYEPGFEPEFTVNFTATLADFSNFSRLCHASGFKAFGYPFSAPLWSASYRQSGWNYGELAATTGVDGLQIQLQGAAHAGATTWETSLQTLITQYAAYDLPTSALSVQLTLAAGDPNNISVSDAYADYEYAVDHGVGQVILWWDEQSTGAMTSLLSMIRS